MKRWQLVLINAALLAGSTLAELPGVPKWAQALIGGVASAFTLNAASIRNPDGSPASEPWRKT